MNKALKDLFIGYFMIWFSFNLLIDWLPDAIGYLFIYRGVTQLADIHPAARKARVFAGAGILIALPSIVLAWFPEGRLLDGYTTLLLVLKLIVTFYLFGVLKAIVMKEPGKALLASRTDFLFRLYLLIHLVTLLLIAFEPNLSFETAKWLLFASSIAILFMDIGFLVLVHSIRKNVPKETFVIERGDSLT